MGNTIPDNASFAMHLWPVSSQVNAAGQLQLSGISLASLAHEYGTPLYVYDEATIRAQCQAFRHAFAKRWPASAIAYAAKAYLSPALCKILREEGMELDAVSAGEIGIALAGGYTGEAIHLHGNYKAESELATALAAQVSRIVVDSIDEIDRLAALAAVRRQRVKVWLRIKPAVEAETHAAIQTGHVESKFGLHLAGEAQEGARRVLASPWLDLVGLHAHAGSQLFDVSPVTQVIDALCEFAVELRETLHVEIQDMSPGGGLGAAYLPEQETPSVETYAEVVTKALAQAVARHHLAPPRLFIEPGRAIVARAGVALYTIGPRKVAATGHITVAVDGGMGDNPRPALYAASYTAKLIERMGETPTETVQIVGRYCESGDVLVKSAALPHMRSGEIVAIPVSGAYHLAMASTYNAVPRPAVVFVGEGKARLTRRRETLDDLLRLEQGID